MTTNDDLGRQGDWNASPGYRTATLGVSIDYEQGKAAEPTSPEHIVLLNDDRYVVTAQRDRLWFYRYEDLADEVDEIFPFATIEAPASVRHLVTRPEGGSSEAFVALEDGSLWAVRAPENGSDDADRYRRSVRRLVENIGGTAIHLIVTRRNVLVVVEERESSGLLLVEVDPAAAKVSRRGPLPLDRLISIAPLDPDGSELLVAVDERHGAYLVGFPTDQDGTTVQLTAFDPDARITAATAVDERWIVAARKGGEISQLRYTQAIGGQSDQMAIVCRQLKSILRECGCSCLEHPTKRRHGCGCGCGYRDCPGDHGPNGPTNGPTDGAADEDDRPGDTGISDDEPCKERRRASLTWTVAELHKAGHYLTALSAPGDRMALLDQRLNVIFERYLGPRGSMVAIGTSADRMVSVRRGTSQIEAWSLGDYARGYRGTPPVPRRADPHYAETVTFRGRRSTPGAPNPHLRVAVFTVTEPGQAFTDPDQSLMQAQLKPRVYDVVRDYYRENSFGTVETQFSVFGVHLGTARRPLVLPRAIASYFYDDFNPGGIEATMPGAWASPLALDGTESMTLRTEPAFGTGKDYAVRFAALWTSRNHGGYPVAVNFTGAETLQVNVVDQTGTARALTLRFAALNLSHAQGDNEAAFLTALGQHVTSAVRAAETAAGAPQVLQDVVFRRIRSNDDDAVFGQLQAQFRVVSSAGATQKGRVSIVAPAAPAAGILALGLADPNPRDGVLGSVTEIIDYLTQCLNATRFDASEGFGLNDPQLATAVVATEDAAAATVRVRIQLATDRGGAGARITLVASTGLAASGWSMATPVPGSNSNSNNRNTMRDHQALANDVFTAALDHIRASGPWDAAAVRNQFNDFDAMMIGFVGACPTTVPVADQWHSANAFDFGRLRMFVRYHQATDLHSPPGETPVTMGTNLLIGQRFDRFDPAVMSHEVGHALGLPDLYFADGFRDDVLYLDRWCQMAGGNTRFNHFCAWSKWSVGWIVESTNASLNRVINVPMPAASGTTTTEAWLVPVEHWDNAMRADVQAVVGSGLPIGQIMKVHLGSDGGVVDLIELRSPGGTFSQQLPPTPAVIVTNVLQPGTDRRWAVNGLYRRDAHLLNDGIELRATGDTWDFRDGKEFPLKGCVVEIVDLRTIRGGTIPICRLKVERAAAEFIDLYFQDNVPSWRSPDIWVDWPGDNPDPTKPRIYPEGTPTDQGEVVRFPSTGTIPHFLVARPHNAGTVRAEDVKVRWFICDPGAGDGGRWIQRDTQTLAEVEGNTSGIAPFTWNVTPSTNSHQCIRAEIIDWTIPAGVDPATGDTLALSSDDVLLQNNNAQKNVFDFEAAT